MNKLIPYELNDKLNNRHNVMKAYNKSGYAFKQYLKIHGTIILQDTEHCYYIVKAGNGYYIAWLSLESDEFDSPNEYGVSISNYIKGYQFKNYLTQLKNYV